MKSVNASMRFQLFIAARNFCKVILNNQILAVFPRLCLCSPVLIVISPVCVSDPPLPPFSCQNVFVLRLFQLFAMFIVFIPSCMTCSVSSSSSCSSPESSLPELFASQTDILSTFTLKETLFNSNRIWVMSAWQCEHSHLLCDRYIWVCSLFSDCVLTIINNMMWSYIYTTELMNGSSLDLF